MKKRSTAKRSISAEEAREAVKVRRFDVAGVFQPDVDEVARLMEQFESIDYLLLTDFLELVNECVRLTISKLQQLESAYATGVPIDVARTFSLSLLRIPSIQRVIDQATADHVQTKVEIDNFRARVRAAAKIASEVERAIERDGAPPSFEDVEAMIRNSIDPDGVRLQLEAARAGDPPITFGDNQQMPVIAPMPKALMSDHKYKVELIVNCLNDPKSEAEVTVIRLLDDKEVPLAFQGLIGVPIRSTFIADKRGKVRRALLCAQLAKHPIALTVEVTRGFRASDGKHSALTIGKLLANQDLPSAIVDAATQLKLDFAS